jgi:hypothetical protein
MQNRAKKQPLFVDILKKFSGLSSVLTLLHRHYPSSFQRSFFRVYRDTTSPFGQLLNNFVRSKFKEKAEYHKRLDTLRNQQQNATSASSSTTATLIDVASPVAYTAGSTTASSSSAAAAATVAPTGVAAASGNETAQSFTEDFVATIVRRFRPLRQSTARISAVTAAVESVMYAQIQSLYASLFADRDELLAQKMKRLLTLSPGTIGLMCSVLFALVNRFLSIQHMSAFLK